MLDAPLEPQAGASLKRPADRRTARRSLSRWAVHLGLLCSAAAALGTLDLLHVRIAIHTDVGLIFVGLVVVHLAQRRRTLARMATRIVRARTIVERVIRLVVVFFHKAGNASRPPQVTPMSFLSPDASAAPGPPGPA